jgi:glycosyltransferase involved in cell wall biosynthesis
VQSVLRQDCDDWQLVISDNASEQDVEGFVDSLDDERIVYRRSERVLGVTENWNRALECSDGEHVIMLGDDDALLDGYLSRMSELIERFERPDVIYTKALLFTYPGVDPARPSGWLMDHGCGEFFAGAHEAFVLEHDRAVQLVRGAMAFRLRYDFNAQFALISRRLIDSLSRFGAFYQSDFPDYYSMNAAFLHAKTIVVDPAPRVAIGVTPKSYGYFHVNDKEREGRTFLGGAEAAATAGTNINVGWLSAMSALERSVGAEHGLTVDRRRYRFVQAAYVYGRYRAGVSADGEIERLELELPVLERWLYRAANRALALADRFVPARRRSGMTALANRLVGQLPPIDPPIVEGRYTDILDVCLAEAPSPSAGATSASAGAAQAAR